MGGAAKGIPLKAMYGEPRLLSSSAPFNFPSCTITIKSLIFFSLSFYPIIIVVISYKCSQFLILILYNFNLRLRILNHFNFLSLNFDS